AAQSLRRWADYQPRWARRWEVDTRAAPRGAGVVRDRQGTRVVRRDGRSRARQIGRQLRALASGRSLQGAGEAAAARAAWAGEHECPEDAECARMGALSRPMLRCEIPCVARLELIG